VFQSEIRLGDVRRQTPVNCVWLQRWSSWWIFSSRVRWRRDVESQSWRSWEYWATGNIVVHWSPALWGLYCFGPPATSDTVHRDGDPCPPYVVQHLGPAHCVTEPDQQRQHQQQPRRPQSTSTDGDTPKRMSCTPCQWAAIGMCLLVKIIIIFIVIWIRQHSYNWRRTRRHWCNITTTTTNNKYVRLRERPYIHTCRSYVHTPRDIDRHAITEALPTLNFTSGWVADSSDFGLLGKLMGEQSSQNGRYPAQDAPEPPCKIWRRKLYLRRRNPRTEQANKKQRETDIFIPCLSACVDNNKVFLTV